ncbi:MAG: VanZ family protein [Caldithrix sp.]|nr:VanZ family protein [Caldithrix sp.]
MRNFLMWHFPWLALMIIIWLQSAQSDLPVSVMLFPHSDKLVHFVIFGILGASILRGMKKSWPSMSFGLLLIFTLLIAGGFGITDEWHQSMVIGRDADYLDWIADLAGIIVLSSLYYKLATHFKWRWF